MDEQGEEREVLVHFGRYMLLVLKATFIFMVGSVHQLIIKSGEFIKNLYHHGRGVPEKDELLQISVLLRVLVHSLIYPLLLKQLADVINCALIIKVYELKDLLLHKLPVVIQVRVLAYFVDGITFQLGVQPLGEIFASWLLLVNQSGPAPPRFNQII